MESARGFLIAMTVAVIAICFLFGMQLYQEHAQHKVKKVSKRQNHSILVYIKTKQLFLWLINFLPVNTVLKLLKK
jgi:hypothetical protein